MALASSRIGSSWGSDRPPRVRPVPRPAARVTKVVSTAAWAPCHNGSPLVRTSMRRESASGASALMNSCPATKHLSPHGPRLPDRSGRRLVPVAHPPSQGRQQRRAGDNLFVVGGTELGQATPQRCRGGARGGWGGLPPGGPVCCRAQTANRAHQSAEATALAERRPIPAVHRWPTTPPSK